MMCYCFATRCTLLMCAAVAGIHFHIEATIPGAPNGCCIFFSSGSLAGWKTFFDEHLIIASNSKPRSFARYTWSLGIFLASSFHLQWGKRLFNCEGKLAFVSRLSKRLFLCLSPANAVLGGPVVDYFQMVLSY